MVTAARPQAPARERLVAGDRRVSPCGTGGGRVLLSRSAGLPLVGEEQPSLRQAWESKPGGHADPASPTLELWPHTPLAFSVTESVLFSVSDFP